MSGHDCIPVEQLAEVAALPANDARRRDAVECPRCRARLAAFSEFVAPTAVPAEARVEDADARLVEALAREMGGALQSSRPAPAPTRRAPRRFAFAPRFAWAAAAAVVVIAGAWLALPRRGVPVLRGRAGGVRVEALAPERSGKALVLAWKPFAGAEGYAVRFVSLDLTGLADVPAIDPSRLTLSAGALPAGLPEGARVLWQVVAIRHGDSLATSPLQPVTLP
jgi:hypothetical protein